MDEAAVPAYSVGTPAGRRDQPVIAHPFEPIRRHPRPEPKGRSKLIAKRYGTKLHSVQPNFDAHAMNEIGFTRDHEWSGEADEFFSTHELKEAHELTAAAEGDTQGEVEAALLKSLQDQLMALADAAHDGVVLIDTEQGTSHPKTRHTQTTKVVEGVNRFYFRFTIEPPLRAAVYRKRD